MMRAEEYNAEEQELAGVRVEVRSYRLGDTYYCHVANKDAGATIARASGVTRQEAVQEAVEKAKMRLR
ncbi:MAG TPA: hypothetical protein VNL69_06360 [Bacteroidota bacterium]|nr:hypothetical protein [Bacteroidota bacterium]